MMICNFVRAIAVVGLTVVATSLTGAQSTNLKAKTLPGYATIYYKSGRLNIEAYLYKPAKGEGPFPLVIYNHGSRSGHERDEVPFRYVANVLVAQGWAVLVPERRGY